MNIITNSGIHIPIQPEYNKLVLMDIKSSEKPQTASFGQILMGREPGISHYVFTTASSYDEMMKGFEVNFSSKSFRDS